MHSGLELVIKPIKLLIDLVVLIRRLLQLETLSIKVLHADHGLIISSLPPFLEGDLLLPLHVVRDVHLVVELDLLFQVASDCLILAVFRECFPILSPNEEASANRIGFVDILGPFVISEVVGSDDQVVLDPQHVVLEPVDLKSDVHTSNVEEHDLIHLIQLVEDDDVLVLMAGLQVAQQTQHKVAVAEIRPSVDRGLEPILQIGELKSFPVGVQEVLEQKVGVDELLNFRRQLIIDVSIVLVDESN